MAQGNNTNGGDMPRYSIKAIVGPYYFQEDGITCMTSDVHYFHADGRIHADRIFNELAGGAARVYLYDRGELVAKALGLPIRHLASL